MKNDKSLIEKINQIQKYYEDKGNLLIMGLNDLQCSNSNCLNKSLFNYLTKTLTTKELKPTVIDAFSLLFNKTEHIDYFLENNISIGDIKNLKIYGKINDKGRLTKARNSLWHDKTNSSDDNKKIATCLNEAHSPVVIYSSGVSDLMRNCGNNQYKILKDYKKRNTNPNYFYTLGQALEEATLNDVIDKIDKNFENILSINEMADIYVLGTYFPKVFEREGIDIFSNLVFKYNDRLDTLCKKYNITFINMKQIEDFYSKSGKAFHLNKNGITELTSEIVNLIYQKRCVFDEGINYNNNDNENSFEVTNLGLKGVISSIEKDYEKALNKAISSTGYLQCHNLNIAHEHYLEKEALTKTLVKKTKNK